MNVSEFEETSEGFKNLRLAHEKAQKALAAVQAEKEKLEVELSEARKKIAVTDVEKIVEKQGFAPSVAKIIAGLGVASTEEAVTAWLADNGDAFAKTAPTPPAEPPKVPATPEADAAAAAFGRIAGVDSAGSGDTQDLLSKVQALADKPLTKDQIMEHLATLGGART